MLEKVQTQSRSAPRHFHLLWDEDIERLRDLLQAILEHSEEIVRHWYQLYVLHFGDARTLSEAEFTRIFEPSLRRNKLALLEGDMDGYAAQVIQTGELLAERHVPLEEIIGSLHLFEESAQTVFPADTPTQIYSSFDKLSHVRIILLVSAYFRSHSAAARERIAALEREAARLGHHARTRFHGLVGGSPAMRQLYGRIEVTGAGRDAVLIVGEKGAGKKMVARAIHEIGGGEHTPFVAVSCAAVPPSLISGELFGYKRQAQSDVAADYLGLFRAAEGGTLFLEEICALSQQTQDDLERVLREHRVRPVGSAEEYPVSVRVISSTNHDPESSVSRGQLRAELLELIGTCTVEVPPLRERLDDVALLSDHFVSVLRQRSGRPIYGVSDDSLSALRNFDWPGNVRQLANVMEDAFSASGENTIGLGDLPPLREADRTAPPSAKPSAPLVLRYRQKHIATFAEVERDLIQRALQSTHGNKVQTANLLKISRKKLYAKIAKLGIE